MADAASWRHFIGAFSGSFWLNRSILSICNINNKIVLILSLVRYGIINLWYMYGQFITKVHVAPDKRHRALMNSESWSLPSQFLCENVVMVVGGGGW